jgi:carbon-monoxide dehydrogenase medium subunit
LFETALGPRDVLTAIRVPAATAHTRAGFAEFARRHGDYAIAGLAASARADEPGSGRVSGARTSEEPRADGRGLADVRLAYFGVGSTPVRARNAETALAQGNIDAAVAALAQDLDPPDDVQATGAVKRHLAGVLLRRVAKQLMEPRP